VNVRGVELHVEDTGGTGEAVVFSHGLLSSTSMWRFQVAAFRDRCRCIAWDHRGQGKSELTDSGYDMDTLVRAIRLPARVAPLAAPGWQVECEPLLPDAVAQHRRARRVDLRDHDGS
jgi:pimeloyl-ACP methyl ester carboxylesterase